MWSCWQWFRKQEEGSVPSGCIPKNSASCLMVFRSTFLGGEGSISYHDPLTFDLRPVHIHVYHIAKCADITIPIENIWSTVHFLVCRYFPVSAHQEVLSHTCYRTPKGHNQILLLYPLGQLVPDAHTLGPEIMEYGHKRIRISVNEDLGTLRMGREGSMPKLCEGGGREPCHGYNLLLQFHLLLKVFCH